MLVYFFFVLSNDFLLAIVIKLVAVDLFLLVKLLLLDVGLLIVLNTGLCSIITRAGAAVVDARSCDGVFLR